MNHTELKELRQKRVSLIDAARKIHDLAVTEKRDFKPEEQSKYDKLWAEQEQLQGQIAREESLAGVQTQLASPNRSFKPDGGAPGGAHQEPSVNSFELEKRSVERVHAQGMGALTEMPKEERAAFENIQKRAFVSFLVDGLRDMEPTERRALQLGQGSKGGFLVAPQKFVRDIIAGIDDEVFIRGLATKHELTDAHSLGIPSRDSDISDSDWTTEIQEVSDDTALAYGKRELSPNQLTKRIKVSDTLLERGANPEGEVQDRLRYKFSVTQEKAFLNGSGVRQPLGVFTASTDGIPTSRDIQTGNTVTGPTFDGLIEAKFALKGGYHPRAKWVFHRDIVKLVRKLKDGNNQYIWQASTVLGEPDRILDVPYLMSEFAPNTIAADAYVGIIGDFRWYHIVDAIKLRLKRLDELFSATNETGFQGLMETDGMPVLSEAFARVQLASS